ncbi:MAG: alpha-galactosidase [Planctomycetota bacterium]|nr:MAG: alpha-galactosidase [Planctomycetota bacterium]
MNHINILRIPDYVTVFSETESFTLHSRYSEKTWFAGDIKVHTVPGKNELCILLSAPDTAITRMHLRWQAKIQPGLRFLGDDWERSYGTFEWRGLVPERVMPWYFLIHDGKRTDGYGVKTGARSLCCWQMDSAGLSLWLDVRSGGVGIQLRDRQLEVATVVTRQGDSEESAFQAVRAFCKQMCDRPLMPASPVYGGNNWYYAYGNSSHEQILEDAKLIADLAPSSSNRPFMVIDDGWQIRHEPEAGFNGGPWNTGNEKFPDMAGLAESIKEMGVRPGIWFRPLLTKANVPHPWLLPAHRMDNYEPGPVLDPSIPEVLDHVTTDVKRLTDWGYELIKHDFTTVDISGRLGRDMGRQFTFDGWSFADRSKTTAEIILDLYHTIREAAGNILIIGCNTVGHLAAGLVELQRIGDDTSGRQWERTRFMGINSLAFRAAQHGTFFAVDADCVGLTNQVPWEMNQQWLDLLTRSGTPLFVSASPDAVGPEQKTALKQAFALASKEQPLCEPLDWLDTTCPCQWQLGVQTIHYDWFGNQGIVLSQDQRML